MPSDTRARVSIVGFLAAAHRCGIRVLSIRVQDHSEVPPGLRVVSWALFPLTQNHHPAQNGWVGLWDLFF